eukprot:6201615-Pleurochrysis_carterae.AAC.5
MLANAACCAYCTSDPLTCGDLRAAPTHLAPREARAPLAHLPFRSFPEGRISYINRYCSTSFGSSPFRLSWSIRMPSSDRISCHSSRTI